MSRAMILGMIGAIMIAVVSGCGNKDARDFNIENHSWEFSSLVDDEAGTVVACGDHMKEQYPEAEIRELTCEAKDGIVTICDEDGNRTELGYTIVRSRDTNSMIYELEYADVTATHGTVVSGITEYAKGKNEYTLVMYIGGYTLYFTDRTEE